MRKGYVFKPVCQSFCSQGGVCLSACWDTPPGQTPPPLRAETPPSRRTVRILLECFLVDQYFTNTFLEFWCNLVHNLFSPINGPKLFKCEPPHLLPCNPFFISENNGRISLRVNTPTITMF